MTSLSPQVGLNSILAIFGKFPRPGEVKSRLASATSPRWAANLAHAFLRDILHRFADFPAQRRLVYAPPQARGNFLSLAAGHYDLLPQASGDLGQRLVTYVDWEFSRGANKVLLLGTDSPTLPRALVEQALGHLDKAQVVIGPATDGGYYLLGCTGFFPYLFRDIPWSSEQVLTTTTQRALDAGLTLAVLPPWYDVDTREDAHFLVGHLAALRLAGGKPVAPATEAYLANHPIP